MRPIALVVAALQLFGTQDPRRAASIQFCLSPRRHLAQFAAQTLAAAENLFVRRPFAGRFGLPVRPGIGLWAWVTRRFGGFGRR